MSEEDLKAALNKPGDPVDPESGVADDAAGPPDPGPDAGDPGPDGPGGSDPSDWPVQALGMQGDHYHFLSRSGVHMVASISRLGEVGLLHLMEGDSRWARAKFPDSRRGGPGWDVGVLRERLMGQCWDAGPFDPNDRLRGSGAWPDDLGGLVWHMGNRIWYREAGEWVSCPAGRELGRWLYPKTPPEPKPAVAVSAQGVEVLCPIAPEAIRDLAEFLDRWEWRGDLAAVAPKVAIGFLAGAMICGALPARPHAMITGPTGTGKSTLLGLIRAIWGNQAMATADISRAAIYRKLGMAARPVAVNELEHSEHDRRAEQAIEIVRLTTYEGEGSIDRTEDGQVKSWVVRAAFLLAGVHPPPLEPQDRNRIAVLELGRMPEDAEPFAPGELDPYAAMGPGIRAALLLGWDRVKANIAVYRRELSRAKYDGRGTDIWSVLLGVYDTLAASETTSAEVAAQHVAALPPPPRLHEYDEFSDHWQCLGRLLTSAIDMVGVEGGRYRLTVGELLDESDNGGLSAPKTRELTRRGIRLEERVDEVVTEEGATVEQRRLEYLYVATSHAQLAQIFAGTRWASGGWAGALLAFPDAEKTGTMKFARHPSRAVRLPFASIDVPEEVEVGAAGKGETEGGDQGDKEG